MQCPDCLGSGKVLETAEFSGNLDGSTEFEGRVEYASCPRCGGTGEVADEEEQQPG